MTFCVTYWLNYEEIFKNINRLYPEVDYQALMAQMIHHAHPRYLKNRTPIRLSYLRNKAPQSQHITSEELLDLDQLKQFLNQRFNSVDFEKAKSDVLPFIKDPKELEVWSTDFFK